MAGGPSKLCLGGAFDLFLITQPPVESPVTGGGPLQRGSITWASFLTLTGITGGAPLIALFEKARPVLPKPRANRGPQRARFWRDGVGEPRG
jgi:hypothetical protein